MSVFISFNHRTGNKLAKLISEKLTVLGLDPWWFPKPLNTEQVDIMVHFALNNCNRCIFVWTQNPCSNWTFAELVSIRNYFKNRLPSGEATEAFTIIRDLSNGIKKTDTLPLFSDCEYINYEKGIDLDLSFLNADIPGVVPLYAGDFIYPKLQINPKHINIGKRILYGEIKSSIKALPFKKRFCWVFLEDVYGNRYIQQPRPTFSHKRRWGSAPVNMGAGINSVVLSAVDVHAHNYVVQCIIGQSFSGKDIKEWPGDYYELDRLNFPPLKEKIL